MAETPAERAARIQRALRSRTVNEALRDRAIVHALYLERVKSHTVAKILGFLESEVWPDLYGKLDSRLHSISASGGFDRSVATTQRGRDLRDGIRAIVQAGEKKATALLKDELSDVAVAQAKWEQAAVARTVPVDIDFTLPAPATLRAIIESRPMAGRLLKDAMKDLSAATVRRVEVEINKGIVLGETTPQIVSRIRGTRANAYADGVMETTRREAEAIVRTAVGHTSNHASEITYEENADLLKGVAWLATLDTATCPACGALDGKVFDVGEGERPPLHFNCRCTTTPVLKSFRELGLPFKELSESTRESMNGQVPASVRYPDWIEGQPAAVQDEALGPARAKLLRAGKAVVGDFVDARRGRVLSVRQVTKALGIN